MGGAHRAESSGTRMGQDTTKVPHGDKPEDGTGRRDKGGRKGGDNKCNRQKGAEPHEREPNTKAQGRATKTKGDRGWKRSK